MTHLKIIPLIFALFFSIKSHASCGFKNSIKNLNDLHEFIDFSKSIKTVKKEERLPGDETAYHIGLYEVGFVKKGACKGSPFYVVKILEEDMGKGVPPDRYAIHGMTALLPSTKSALPQGNSIEYIGGYTLAKFVVTKKKAICVSDCGITNGDFIPGFNLRKTLYQIRFKKNPPKGYGYVYDPISNYFTGEGNIEISHKGKKKPLNVKYAMGKNKGEYDNFQSETYGPEDKEIPIVGKATFWPHGKRPTIFNPSVVEKVQALPLLAQSKSFGSLYLDNNRMGILVWPDFRVLPVNLGIIKSKKDYVYAGTWDSVKKALKLKNKDLVRGQKGTWILNSKSKGAMNFLKRAYEQYKKNIKTALLYNRGYKGGIALRFEKYLEQVPFLIEEDALGEKLFYRKQLGLVGSAAEPLVYLYSEEPLKVSIKLDPEIELLAHHPKYENEWKVRIEESGKLTDLKTGKVHPYLFWEGHRGSTPAFTNGWTIANKDLPEFFDQILSSYGLIQNEINDFKKYWLKEMTTSPFYKIRFFTEVEMDRVFPLHVTPQPDSVIRVHMEYQPLERRIISLPVPTVRKPPARTGFTLVEWSGFDYSWWIE